MTEQELIDGCKRNDPQCQRVLYEIFAPKMLGVCNRYVNNRHIAQDLLQDGFVKAFTKIGTYLGEGAFGGWLRRIFVTTSLEYLRKKDLLKFSVSIDDFQHIADEQSATILSQLAEDDLLACISRLPTGYRTVFNLYAIEGYAHCEIAKMLDIKEKTSQSQLVRARKILQKEVQSIINHKYTKHVDRANSFG